MIAVIGILVLTLAHDCFLTMVDRRQGWVSASKRRARSDAPYRKTNFCFDAGPHLNPLPPGRGLSLIVLRGGSAASAFIQSKDGIARAAGFWRVRAELGEAVKSARQEFNSGRCRPTTPVQNVERPFV